MLMLRFYSIIMSVIFSKVGSAHHPLPSVSGIKIAVAIGETQAFKRMGAQFHQVPMPGCIHTALWTDEYWECLARHYTSTIYHPVGTAKMGPYWDPEAVVDPELRLVPTLLQCRIGFALIQN